MRTLQILPSLLSANLLQLGQEVDALISAKISMLHLDIMDNHYVPNLTFGPGLCEALHQRFKTLSIDVHLMVKPVDPLIPAFAKAGATRISIHPDATLHLDRSLDEIKKQGLKAGLVLNPATPIDCLEWTVHQLDFVLVMTVNPGFGGQALLPHVIPKIHAIHERYPNLPICVDGGINEHNIADLHRAGASEFVMGAAFFKNKDYTKTLLTLQKTLNHAPT